MKKSTYWLGSTKLVRGILKMNSFLWDKPQKVRLSIGKFHSKKQALENYLQVHIISGEYLRNSGLGGDSEHLPSKTEIVTTG